MPVFEYFTRLISSVSPFFWVITEGDEVSGFVYLDNLIGDNERLHSAELSTCFKMKYWGDYTKKCAKLFLNFCFERFGFYKIKALVYPENSRVITLLKHAGFEKEAFEAKKIRHRRGWGAAYDFTITNIGEIKDIEGSVFQNDYYDEAVKEINRRCY